MCNNCGKLKQWILECQNPTVSGKNNIYDGMIQGQKQKSKKQHRVATGKQMKVPGISERL
jgi:hypothetical protein